MKSLIKKNIGLIVLMLIFSCSSDSSDSSFEINAIMTSSTVNVDEHFVVTVTSPEEMTGIEYSFDNFKNSYGEFRVKDYVKSRDLSFKFLEIGTYTLYLRAFNQNNVQSPTKVVQLNVVRGNRVKIKGLKITSFSGINTSWDPEYNSTDPNRLADVTFSFTKSYYQNAFSIGGYFNVWYKTSVKENQGDLTWSFENDNLYTDPNSYLYFSIYDIDGSSLAQDLNPNYYPQSFNLSSYISTKPSSVTFSFPDNIVFILELEWAK